jgi:copper chaperone CopZ
METLTLELPSMYGDHHVVEVRRILLAMPGVEEVYASSAFRAVEITFDPAQIEASAIEAALDDAGYLEPLSLPLEPEVGPYRAGDTPSYFRHTAAYQQTGRVVSFAQRVNYAGRPLWPCPGMGPVQVLIDEEAIEKATKRE